MAKVLIRAVVLETNPPDVIEGSVDKQWADTCKIGDIIDPLNFSFTNRNVKIIKIDRQPPNGDCYIRLEVVQL